MREFTKEEFREILELQNKMALAGFDIPFERCAKAYAVVHAEMEAENKDSRNP